MDPGCALWEGPGETRELCYRKPEAAAKGLKDKREEISQEQREKWELKREGTRSE